jgi:hypothetical protein
MNDLAATQCLLVRLAGECPVGRICAIPPVAETSAVHASSTGADELSLPARLKRQREIIHGRRDDLRRFLKPGHLHLVSALDRER